MCCGKIERILVCLIYVYKLSGRSMSVLICSNGVIHSTLSRGRYLMGLMKRAGDVEIKIIGYMVFLKCPFFMYAISVYLGMVFP